MPGKIFYRERRLSEKGFEQPRYQLTALAGVELEILGCHLRLSELKFIARMVDADLVLLPPPSPSDEMVETLEID
jgi:hypothetical protein